MTPSLTNAQRQALKRARGTGPVSVEDPATHVTYVLVRADLYERVQPGIEDDTSDPRITYPFVDEVMAQDDAHDPYLDEYQKMARPPRD